MKILYLLPHVLQICLIQPKHVNLHSNVCYGPKFIGNGGVLAWRLSKDNKDFVLKQLHDFHRIPQIMTKHIDLIQDKIDK